MTVTKLVLLRLMSLSMALSLIAFSHTSTGRLVIAEAILQASERLLGTRYDPEEIDRRTETLLKESGLLEKWRKFHENKKALPS